MNLQPILSSLHLYTNQTNENPDISSIEMDSREVKPGSLFICIKGYTVDGHDYANKAVDKGAVAIIAEKQLEVEVPVIIVPDSKRAMAVIANYFYDYPTQKLQLIGVTGTNGKTSTTHMIEKIMQAAKQKTGLIGTIHTKIGDQVFETKNTTPESLTLQKTFSNMHQAGVDTAIMEVSSHALDLGRVHGCDFDIAVFTNLTQDHLDYHGTMQEYQRVKGLLFAQLGNTFHPSRKKFAILNADDPASNEYKRSTAAHIITYGIQADSDIMAKHIQMTNTGTMFTLTVENRSYQVRVQLVGLFSVYNVLAAISACIAANIPLETILSTLEKLEGVPGRFELVQAGQDFAVVVDYAHTPDSLENAIKTVKEFTKGSVYTIVGCGGDRDKTKRPLVANISASLSDVAIFTSDNPRSGDPVQILSDMEAGVENKDSYHTILDREEAINFAISQAKTGDVVLIAGKGHETYQIIGHEVLDFDDREVAKEDDKGEIKVMLTLADVKKDCPLQRGLPLDEIGFKVVYFDPELSVSKGLFVPIFPSEEENTDNLKTALYNGAIATLWNKEQAIPSFLPTHFPVFLVEDPIRSLELIVKNYIHSQDLKGTKTVDTKFSFSMINKHIDDNMSYSNSVRDNILKLKESIEVSNPEMIIHMKGGEEE